MASQNSGNGFFSRQTVQNYHEDCDMLFFCEKNAQTYRLCYKGAPLSSKRCTPAEKNLMLMFSQVVHRSQLMDETIKQLATQLGQLQPKASSPAAAAAPRAEGTRFEQSQAASLVGTMPAGGTISTEAAEERADFSPLFSNAGATPERDKPVRRNETERTSRKPE